MNPCDNIWGFQASSVVEVAPSQVFDYLFVTYDQCGYESVVWTTNTMMPPVKFLEYQEAKSRQKWFFQLLEFCALCIGAGWVLITYMHWWWSIIIGQMILGVDVCSLEAMLHNTLTPKHTFLVLMRRRWRRLDCLKWNSISLAWIGEQFVINYKELAKCKVLNMCIV